jgi:endoglycosylceramidase
MRLFLRTVLPIILLSGVCSRAAAASLDRLDHQGRWLVDEQARVVMLRGGNIPLPGTGKPEGRADADTPRMLAQKGFNAVRLVVFFDRLMPSAGRVDEAYLDEIARAVAAYRDSGVYVLLDLHQDEYGPAVGVRGMPVWATFAGGHEPKRLPFPAGYFRDPAIHAAFDNFWRNHPVGDTGKGVQDFYIGGVAALAARFADESAVFGIDLMNEPFPGSRCNQPDPASAHCPDLERELLAPFYQRAGDAIARVAPDMIVFVEPFMLQGALGVPIQTPPPGSIAKRGLSFHQYGTLAEIRIRGNELVMQSALATGSVPLNTEWGFTNDPQAWTAQAEEFDALLIPWMAWARGPFAPVVDERLPAAGNDNREATLRALARPYPRATAGTPLALAFDGTSGTLDYRFSTTAPGADKAHGGLTEIVMPVPNYPAGYTLTIDDGAARVVSSPDAPLLVVRADAAVEEVHLRAVRKGSLPELPPIVATANPYAQLGATNPAAKPTRTGTLSTNSMVSDLLGDVAARAILEREVPDLVNSPQIGMGSQMTLRALQPFVPQMLSDEVLERIDRALARQQEATTPVH